MGPKIKNRLGGGFWMGPDRLLSAEQTEEPVEDHGKDIARFGARVRGAVRGNVLRLRGLRRGNRYAVGRLVVRVRDERPSRIDRDRNLITLPRLHAELAVGEVA